MVNVVAAPDKSLAMNEDELQQHVASTYVSLRLGIGVIGAALPLLLWLGGAIGDAGPLRPSMSAYYYSPTMRDVFVGALIVVGVCLYLYKGFSVRENVALNLAGACAVGVALIPTTPPGTDSKGLTWHWASAALLFVFIAYVSIFRSADTLSLIRDTQKAKRLREIYRGLGLGMALSPVIGLAFSILEPTARTFFLEMAAVLMFAAYWLTKTYELRFTHAERLALDGKLLATPPSAPPAGPASGRVLQAEP